VIAFTESDLLADISQKELDGIAKKLVEQGDPQPISVTIAEQLRKVEDYAKRWKLEEERWKRLTRALVLFELYSRVGSIPEKRKLKYEEAMKELREIRDGKFPDLAEEAPAPEGLPSGRGRWGSAEKI
jgi:hypothetical protein